jgi:molybdate transport system substrate-binding protein
MRTPLIFVAAVVSSVWPVSHRSASVDQMDVLSAVGMRQVLVELAPMFERAAGHTLRLAFDSGATIVRRIEAGEAADVVVVPHDAAGQLAAAGKVMGDSITDVASSRVGVAVRAGARHPDISSPAALRQTLLAVRSVARPDPAQGGSSGLHIQKTFERLGIADALAATSVLSSHPDREDEMPGVRLARGEAELALHQIQELAVPGVVVIGPLPGGLDGQFMFAAALVSGTPQADAGRELIAFLLTAHAKAVINGKGMQAAGGDIRAAHVSGRRQFVRTAR